jgi:hemoglobin/transferrin/lactoferrin receptor protein
MKIKKGDDHNSQISCDHPIMKSGILITKKKLLNYLFILLTLIVFNNSVTFFFPHNLLLAEDSIPQVKKRKSDKRKEKDSKKEKSKQAEKKKEDKPIEHEIEVVAKRIPQPVFKTDRSVSLFHKELLQEQRPRTVPEALLETPGTFVQHTNLGGGSPIVRGMIGPQILIMVDGVRFNNSTYRTGPGQYLNLIDPLLVERIEILRGPGSVLYGSDAMGGVVQVMSLPAISPLPNRNWGLKGNLLFRYGSADNSRILNGHFDLGYKNLTISSGVSYKEFADLRGGKGVGIQPYVGYGQLSTIGKAVYRFSDGALKDWFLTFGYMLTRLDDAGRIDKLYDSNSLQIYDNVDHLLYGRLHFESPLIKSHGDLTISYQDFFEQKDNHKVENDYKTVIKTTQDKVTAQTLGIDLNMLTMLHKNFRFNYGMMWYKDFVDADQLIRNKGEDWVTSYNQNYPDGSTYSNYGAYALMEWEPIHFQAQNFIRISGGCRWHGMSAYVPEKNQLPAVDFSYNGYVFSLSAQYLHGNISNVAITFSQGFRSPNLQESVMLGDTGKFFHIPNYDLKPERLDMLELLTRGCVGNMIITLSGYVSFLKNIIKRESTLWQGKNEIEGKEVVFNVNGGKGLLWGAEGSLMLDLGRGFIASGHVTYTWGEEWVSDGEDIPLTRIPPLFGQIKIRYDKLRIKGWEGFIECYVRASGKQDRLSMEDIQDVRIPSGGTPGWWTLNIRAGARILKHMRMSLSVENVFNKKYKYHASGIYSPGTNATFSLEFF